MIKLGDALLKLGIDKSDFDKDMANVEKETKKSLSDIGASMTKTGVAFTAMGAAITAPLGLMVKSAEEERVQIALLEGQLKNVGVAYDDVSKSLEANITAMQRKTGIADSEQRDALSKLLLVTNDYQKSLDLLPMTLDLAKTAHMDSATAAQYLGRVIQGDVTALTRYGIIIDKDATSAEALAIIQERVAGAAEAAASPFAILKAEMGDLSETIGTMLLPILSDLLKNYIMPTIARVQEWIKENPELAKKILIVVGAFGAMATVIGPILIALPLLAEGLVLLTDPIGLVVLAIMGIVAAAIRFRVEILKAIDSVLGALEKLFNFLHISTTGIKKLREDIANIIDAVRIKKNAKEAEETVKEFEKQAGKSAKYTEELEKERHDNVIKHLEEEYGETENVDNSKKALARKASEVIITELDRQKDAARGLHDFNIKNFQDEYDKKVSLLDAETKATIKALNDQINALDEQAEVEDRAKEDAERAAQRSALIQQIAFTGGNQNAWDALFKFDEESREILAKRERADTQESLRNKIDTVQAEVEIKKEQYRLELDAKAEHENAMLLTETNRLESLKGIEDIALAENLARIETEKQVFIAAEQAKYDAVMAVINASKGIITTPPAALPSVTAPDLAPFAHGGVIPEPTLLYGLKSMRPYAIAGEAGPERVVPGNQTADIRIYLDGRTIAEALGQPLVNIIRARTGVMV